ncbi:MAG TPA: hypothetical protein PLL69_04735, partial [Gemmatimonadales bacterium]|nr:hypothetical protein [Gemmatimonadales bacterium]
MGNTLSDTDRERIGRSFEGRFRLGSLVATSAERVLFRATDLLLDRSVSLRVNLGADPQLRRWFLKEAVALARLDHPAIRHLYEAAFTDGLAYRVGNWIYGESLEEAIQRGPRPVPSVHLLARDLLTALEHAHANGIHSYTGVAEVAWFQQIRTFGWDCTALGEPGIYDGRALTSLR